MRNRVGIAILTLTLGATLVACGDDTKTVTTKDGKITVNKDKESVTIEGEDGSASFGDGTKVPDGFPTSDVPLPDGLKLQTAVSPDDGKSFQLGYQISGAKLADAVADYQDALESDSFTIDDAGSVAGGGNAYSGFRATGNGWSVTVSGIGGSATGILAVSVTEGE